MNDWRDQAACKGKPTDWFFPDDEQYVERSLGLAVCASCPVVIPCRKEGVYERFGTWGGTSVNQRKRYRRVYRDGVA